MQRLFRWARLGAAGTFFTGILSAIQGCDAREGALFAFLLIALNFCTGPVADNGGGASLTTMYVTSFANDKVFRANLDGTGGQDLGSAAGFLD